MPIIYAEWLVVPLLLLLMVMVVAVVLLLLLEAAWQSEVAL